MRLLVHMMVPLGAARGSSSEIFESRVVRLHGPVLQGRGRTGKLEPYIVVDVELPERLSGLAARRRFNQDGTYRVDAYLSENRWSLAGFLASGALELYVGDEP
ncbi:hypothetical protein DX980_20135 [Burkholderia gladioli]|uniref:hypothetical protein n=1 Tax=Burkholderia gladioli TaxID=28095 RepID=UPI001364A9BF|nr:hypothetical protein [Burkholderia gladioli]KAF1065266.1 hypothetical protein LvStA_03941 [Burkholderia gladioli]WAG21356.1 hypothetical protein DX980_20135 [Burkholderia gladioli]